MSNNKPNLSLNLEYLQNMISNIKIAIISAKWNATYNNEIALEASKTLKEAGLKESNIHTYNVPGAFELPMMASRLAKSKLYDAIICVGTIIRGKTYHFEIIANESARGLMNISIEYDLPIINGILTVNSDEQAATRAYATKDNKGNEFAQSCLLMLAELNRI